MQAHFALAISLKTILIFGECFQNNIGCTLILLDLKLHLVEEAEGNRHLRGEEVAVAVVMLLVAAVKFLVARNAIRKTVSK